MIHFVYMWFDKTRKMFYVGQHSGSLHDSYISSSRWLTAEIRYRPTEFKRRVVKIFSTKNEAQVYEGYLLKLISPHEFGTKYYNLKQGKPIGTPPWNKGKQGVYSDEYRRKLSEARKGKPTTKGRPNPFSAENGRRGAKKLSEQAKGRKREYLPNGKWFWKYPTTSVTEQVGTISES